MEEAIKERLDDFEIRLKKVEAILFKEDVPKKNVIPKTYKGLAGGIRFLIDNEFFEQPKSVQEIISELKREGYHYTQAGVASTLSETFTKSQKILNRIKTGKVWKYVLRK